MGYYPYQKLNGNAMVTSKGRVRKMLRREGRGKGGCKPAAHSAASGFQKSSEPLAPTQPLQNQGQGELSVGKCYKSEPNWATCHKGHANYYPDTISVGDVVCCRICNQFFRVQSA